MGKLKVVMVFVEFITNGGVVSHTQVYPTEAACLEALADNKRSHYGVGDCRTLEQAQESADGQLKCNFNCGE